MAKPVRNNKKNADQSTRKARKARTRNRNRNRANIHFTKKDNNNDNANKFWHKRRAMKEARIKAGTWKELKIVLSDSETTVSNSVATPDCSTVPLSWVMPQSGFIFPYHSQVTSRPSHDMSIKTAITETGVTFDRSSIVPQLAVLFETAAISCCAVYATDPDDSNYTALMGAIETCKRGTKWAHGLSEAVFADLVLSIRAARRVYLKVTGFDDTEPGSWGRTLGVAVDEFDAAVLHRGWGTTRELLDMEAADDDDDYTKDISSGLGAMDINKAGESGEDQMTEKEKITEEADEGQETDEGAQSGEDDEEDSDNETMCVLSMELY